MCHAFVHGALFIRKGMVMFPTHNPVDYVRAFGIAFAAGMATGMSVKQSFSNAIQKLDA